MNGPQRFMPLAGNPGGWLFRCLVPFDAPRLTAWEQQDSGYRCFWRVCGGHVSRAGRVWASELRK
jgi:hypothetical protein